MITGQILTAKTIAEHLETPMRGENVPVVFARSLNTAADGALVFLSKNLPDMINNLNELHDVVCITNEEIAQELSVTVLIHAKPRLAFCKALAAFFSDDESREVDKAALIDSDAIIGENVVVGPGSHIASSVSIGKDSKIGSNVVIGRKVSIGHGCVIKSNSTIGEPGFGFSRDERGRPVRFPHIGSVEIGNHVEIGANCTVVRAALDTTIIHDFVKTDDHVHIAHNCRIGQGTLIAAGAVISGSVTVGAGAWISPNVTIIDKASIGDEAFIGIGSVVTKTVAAGGRVFGVPAREISRTSDDKSMKQTE